MKKLCFRVLTTALLLCMLMGSASAYELLVPVGRTIGISLEGKGVTVVELQEGEACPARQAGIEPGDIITQIGQTELNSAEDLQQAVEQSKGTMTLTVRHKGKERQVTVQPSGDKRLGVYVRDGITGIGTVTYYDPQKHTFGALGHGVNTSDGDLAEMTAGEAMAASVVSVKRGQVGTPGQLKGVFSQENTIGSLTANTRYGLFGKSETGWLGEPLPTAEASEIHTGKATILSNVESDKVASYDVEILKLYPGDKAAGRNMLLQVTDESLLQKTGGIVQGMSGSPIVQDGKLIGAVTHVLVNDPTTGYGIFIENMLDAAA